MDNEVFSNGILQPSLIKDFNVHYWLCILIIMVRCKNAFTLVQSCCVPDSLMYIHVCMYYMTCIIFPLYSLPACVADVMADMGAEKIIAVDVGSLDNNNLTNYGDHISGWYILWNRLNPFAEKIRVRGLRADNL